MGSVEIARQYPDGLRGSVVYLRRGDPYLSFQTATARVDEWPAGAPSARACARAASKVHVFTGIAHEVIHTSIT